MVYYVCNCVNSSNICGMTLWNDVKTSTLHRFKHYRLELDAAKRSVEHRHRFGVC